MYICRRSLEEVRGCVSLAQVPVTFIYGDRDWTGTDGAVRAMAGLAATRPAASPTDQQLITVPDAGHCAPTTPRPLGAPPTPARHQRCWPPQAGPLIPCPRAHCAVLQLYGILHRRWQWQQPCAARVVTSVCARQGSLL